LETYLSPSDDHDSWQPTIQGRIVHIEWDQKAKPTPMLVLEQSIEGVNVTFRTTRTPAGRPTTANDSQLVGAKGQKNGKSSSKTPAKGATKSPAKVGGKRPGSRK
ncbi:hypothetical protein ON021_15900, partial [Microcoleus sp. HI-ES]|nr:hypothetical protein [Microcoleus sp. HI-ES]